MNWRTWAAIPAAAVMALGVAIGAASATPTQIPAFPSNHVYVDPALAGAVSVPSDLEAKITAAAARQHLQVYEVILKLGDERIPKGSNPALEMSRNVAQSWSSNRAFPSDRCEIIVVLVKVMPDGSNRKAAGVTLCNPQQTLLSGSAATDAVTKKAVFDHIDDIVSPNNDWDSFSVGVVSDINAAIGRAAAAAQQTTQPTTQPLPQPTTHPPVTAPPVIHQTTPTPTIGGHPVIETAPSGGFHIPGWGWFLIFVAVVAAISFVITLFTKGTYNSETEKTKPVTDNLGTQVEAFKVADNGMAAGKRVYSGKSLARYTQGLMHSGKYFLYSPAVVEQNKKINAVVPSGFMGLFAFWSWMRATSMVNAELVIDQKELAPELVKATSGKFVTTKATFKDAVAVLATEFDAAQADFLVLNNAFKNASADKKLLIGEDPTKVTGLIGQIEAAKDETVKAGMSWELFAAEHDAVLAEVETLKKLLMITGGDPISGLELSTSLKARATKLLQDIEDGVDMLKHVTETAEVITAAHKKVNDAKASPCTFVLVRKMVAENWKFDEVGGNPQPFLDTADQELGNVKTLLAAGKVDDAKAAKAKALAAAEAASRVVDTVEAAKAELDKEGAVLQARFHESLGFGALVKAYGEQRFLTAQKALHAFQAVATTQDFVSEVQAKHTRNFSAITSKKTDDAFNLAAQGWVRAGAALDQENVDWVKAKETVDASHAAFKAVDEAIDADVTNHGNATTEVGGLRAAYNGAHTVASDRRTDPARRKALEGVRGEGGVDQTIADLESDLRTPKSDWKSINEKARQTLATIGEIKQAAQHDIEVDAEYKEELDRAQAQLTGFGQRRVTRQFGGGADFGFNPGAIALLVAAEAAGFGLWRIANQEYSNREYDGMERQIESMKQQLWEANSQANYLLLQDMYNSGDPLHQHYAETQGYRHGSSYESWRNSEFRGNVDYGTMYEPTPISQWRPEPDSGFVRGRDSSGAPSWVPEPTPAPEQERGGQDLSNDEPRSGRVSRQTGGQDLSDDDERPGRGVTRESGGQDLSDDDERPGSGVTRESGGQDLSSDDNQSEAEEPSEEPTEEQGGQDLSQ
jgi:hypothetical protein